MLRRSVLPKRVQERTPPTSAEKRTKQIYQVCLIISLIFNGLLGARAAWNSERLNSLTEQKTKLETQKANLENELLEAKTVPAFSFSRLRYEIGTFDVQLRKQSLVPFLSNIKDYRILQNRLFDSLDHDVSALRRGLQVKGTVTFLVIANVSTVSAYATKAGGGSANDLELGDLLPQSAVLIPIQYVSARGKYNNDSAISVSSLKFQTSLGPQRTSHEVAIPPQSAQSWIPVLDNLHGIGRALVMDDDRHIQKVLPSDNR